MHSHHRSRWSPVFWIRKRMQRAVFAWILLVAVVTLLVVGGMFRWFGRDAGVPDAVRGAERFVGHRFSDVWSDPRARARLVLDTAAELAAGVRVRDLSGRSLEQAGDATCAHPWSVAVVDANGHRRGNVEVCFTRVHRAPRGFIFAVLVCVALLWMGAGAISRRLARPMEAMAQAATRLGEGHWQTRITPGRHATHEARTLAAVFNLMAERVQQQIADQKTLLAAVSHELRTPLARMRLLIELGRNDGEAVASVAGEHDGAWAKLDGEVDELDTLVGDLLASSRLDFATRPDAVVDVRDVVVRAVEAARVEPTLIAVDSACDDGANREVAGDATLLVRAVVNLLENAKKHGGGVRSVDVNCDSEGVRIAVVDCGPGIADAELSKIFTPFYRPQSTEQGNQANSSSGFGLALVRRVVEWHGGAVRAENVDAGARFVLWLPRKPRKHGANTDPGQPRAYTGYGKRCER